MIQTSLFTFGCETNFSLETLLFSHDVLQRCSGASRVRLMTSLWVWAPAREEPQEMIHVQISTLGVQSLCV